MDTTCTFQSLLLLIGLLFAFVIGVSVGILAGHGTIGSECYQDSRDGRSGSPVYEWDGVDSSVTRGQAVHGVITNNRLTKVDLSGDGNTVAIGSGKHDNRAGHVCV